MILRLLYRLSKEMEVKIAQDESSLENISVKNRPMNVAEDFLMFNSDEWLDAKTALDSHMDDDSKEAETTKVQLLHDILMVCISDNYVLLIVITMWSIYSCSLIKLKLNIQRLRVKYT